MRRVSINGVVGWLAGHVNLVLVVVLLIVGGVWGFVVLADEVKEGGTQKFDQWVIGRLHRPAPVMDRPAQEVPIGPEWLVVAGRDITALGGGMVLILVTGFVLGYLLIVGKHHAFWLVLVAVLGGGVIGGVLKEVFNRPRPELTRYVYVSSSSFPSGHSLMSAVVYLTLGSLLTRLTPKRRVKLYFLGAALLLTFLVGVSRVYMGVHYPTDVLAGWTAGLVWALVCWVAARWLQRRGAVEGEGEEKVTR